MYKQHLVGCRFKPTTELTTVVCLVIWNVMLLLSMTMYKIYKHTKALSKGSLMF